MKDLEKLPRTTNIPLCGPGGNLGLYRNLATLGQESHSGFSPVSPVALDGP